MVAVVFDYSAWAIRYPTLAAVTDEATATGYFQDAELTMLGNDLAGDPPSIVCNPARRLALFNLLVAHIATLEQRNAAAGLAGGVVGNVTGAGEGSVNVKLSDYASDPGKWYEQTQPGATFWQAVQPYMRAFYLPGPQAYTGPGYPFAGGRFGGRYSGRW